jgi:hypothetical protein
MSDNSPHNNVEISVKPHCYAHGCKVEVAPVLFMCQKHWRMLPKHLRQAVRDCYRPGQEHDELPSQNPNHNHNRKQDWLNAARAAKGYVAGKENKCARCGRDLVALNKNSPLSPLGCPPCIEATVKHCAAVAEAAAKQVEAEAQPKEINAAAVKQLSFWTNEDF